MFIRKMTGKGVVLFLPLALLFVLGHLTSAHASGGWTKLYSGSSLSAAVVASGETRGQHFEATEAFNSLRVSSPSWGNSVGNLTLTLYGWDTDYATSVAGAPLARRTFANFADNAWLEMGFPDRPAGEYVWVLSDSTELVGVYAYLDSAHPSTGYYNGVAMDYDYVSEVYLANPPLTATILTPFLGQLNTSVEAGDKNDYWAGALRSDPGDSSKVMYLFDWGDGTQSLSGQTIPNLSGPTDRYSGRGIHSWSSPGQYEVKAKAFDARGTPSAEWSPSVTVSVYGSVTPPSPIVPVNVTASSEYGPANAAAKAADGDPLTFWSSSCASSAYDDPQWIRFDLGGIRIVDSVELTARPSGLGFPAALKLQYSLDDSIWFDMPVLDFPVYPNPGDVPQLLETNGINARYLRIYSDRRGHDGHAYYTQLADVKIYGSSENTFFTSLGGTFDAYLNNMWTVFGTAKNETVGGGTDWTNTTGGIIASASTEWHYWDALKLAWTSEEEAKNHFRKVIYNIPMDADGFVWGCEYCRLHLGVQKHSSNNPMYILGAYEYYMWTRDDTFLTKPLPAFTNVNAPPLPTGVNTLLDKLRKSLDWMLSNYNGSSGLFVYTEPGYDGIPSSQPNASNYWDNIPFGYKDAYANALMFQATKAMADLEEALGNTAEAANYRGYLPGMKSAFNATFWDAGKGRYIATVDVNGGKRDYGFTYLNTMAVRFGLADANQASLIYQWLDGARIVSGDTSQGSDIYDGFKYAPRSNTLDIASSTPYWWDGEAFGVDPGPSGNSRYGANAQNGGAILYTSFDDIMGRIETVSPDSGFGRLQAILAEFAQDELRRSRDLPNGAGFIGHGIVGEFPESGLVPAVMTHGFLGLSAELDGLLVAPKLPSSLTYAGASDIRYRGDKYKITASRAVGSASIVSVGPGSYELTVPDGLEVVVTGGSIVSTGSGGGGGGSGALPEIAPAPQSIQALGASFALEGEVGIVVGASADPYAVEAVEQVLAANGITDIVQFDESDTVDSPIAIWIGGPSENGASQAALASIGADASPIASDEGYVLAAGADGSGQKRIVLYGMSPRGTFYAAQSFRQAVQTGTGGPRIAGLEVRDWPVMAYRGTVEGFYNEPWSHEDRLSQLDFYGRHKMNTYVYAPKDDPYHRHQWRDPYPQQEMDRFEELIERAEANHVDFTFAISPGDSICFSCQADFNALTAKAQALWDLGVRSFALYLDDIDPSLRFAEDRAVFGGDVNPSAAAQAYLLNKFNEDFIKTHPGAKRLLTVPTDYMTIVTTPYIDRYAELLDDDIIVQWTGYTTASKVITAAHAEAAKGFYKHDIVVWDNYPVNDLFSRANLYIGPLTGRDPDLADHGIIGFVSNPMNEAEASKIAVYNYADYLWNPEEYDAAESWSDSLKAFGGEAADALRTFAENTYSSPLNEEESIVLRPLIEAFRQKYEASDPFAAEVSSLQAEFVKLKQAIPVIREEIDNPKFLQEAEHHLRKMELYGQAGAEAVAMLTAQKEEDELAAMVHRAGLDDSLRRIESVLKSRNNGVLHGFLQWAAAENDRMWGAPALTGLIGTTNKRTYQTYSIDKMVDGSESTYFWGEGGVAKGDYVAVELPEITTIRRIQATMGNYDRIFKGTVEISLDGIDWAVVSTVDDSASGVNPGVPTYTLNVELPGYSAKFVRLRSSVDQQYWLRVYELSVTAADGARVATSLPYSQHSPLNMTDGHPGTYFWSGRIPKAGDEIVFDPAPGRTTRTVGLLMGEEDYVKQGVIEYTEDGQVWHELAVLSGDNRKIVSVPGLNIQSLRLRVTQDQDSWLTVYEFFASPEILSSSQ